MANTPTAQEKKVALTKQIEGLQKQIESLDQDAIHELKLKISDARKVVKDLENQLEELTGIAPTQGRTRRVRRPAIADEALQPQLLKVMAQYGKEGMNAKQMAEKLNQDALRIRKFITANPKVLKRQGAGPGTKFFLQ